MTGRLRRAVLSAVVLVTAALACRGDGPTGPTFQITDTTLRPGVVGQPYADTLDATGGARAKSWTLVRGTLPAGRVPRTRVQDLARAPPVASRVSA